MPVTPHTATAPKRLSILGATGSIGSTTLELVKHYPEQFDVVALTAQENVEKLIELALNVQPKMVTIGNSAHEATLKEALAGTGIRIASGKEGLLEAANEPADITMSAIVGAAGLAPTMQAIARGGRVALANKECLVCAGGLMLDAIQKYGAELLPVDSEHNAIYQVFDFERPERIEKVTLTASGGPFRTFTREQMAEVTPEQAVAHPNWDMGAKISVDSATMMNKGLELIEAYYLFPVKEQQIDILVHPESAIHSMVHYTDGSVLAQLGTADMTTPIAYALAWPDRLHSPNARLDFAKLAQLTFEAPDLTRFPALRLAREALQTSAAAPIILNAANEIAVARFLKHALGFLQITELVGKTLERLTPKHITIASLEDVLALDQETRMIAEEIADGIR